VVELISGQRNEIMPRTILCSHCGISLNLPPDLRPGKRVKCPKCGTKFQVDEADLRPASKGPGLIDASASTTIDLRRSSSLDDLPIPVAAGDLRETFDLPLMTEAASPVPGSPAGSGPKDVSDAEALFQDDPAPRRRVSAAEARSRARRCSSCHGVVPAGMSICIACGTDQETGLRVGLDDDLAPPPPPPPSGAPLHVAVVGGICALSGVILTILSLAFSAAEESSVEKYGWYCLAIVSVFGAYAAVEFIRGKSVKLLLVALTLGAFIDLAAMIALPIINANLDTGPVMLNAASHQNPATGSDGEDLDDAGIAIPSVVDRINFDRIRLGLIFLGVYAALSVYLMSPAVKRYFSRQSQARMIILP
jgi:hypothetical protein